MGAVKVLPLILGQPDYCITFAESKPYCHSILFVCLDVCRSFRDLQPTTIDQSQPNFVDRYIPVLGPV